MCVCVRVRVHVILLVGLEIKFVQQHKEEELSIAADDVSGMR